MWRGWGRRSAAMALGVSDEFLVFLQCSSKPSVGGGSGSFSGVVNAAKHRMGIANESDQVT